MASRPVLVLAIWALARIASALTLAALSDRQSAMDASYSWHLEDGRPGNLSYVQLLSNWDGQWYKSIALHGYPSGAQQDDVEGPYAFYPLFPTVVRLGMWMSGASFEAVATALNLTLGAVAMLLLHRWLVRTRGSAVALVAVTVLSFFPTALVFQAAYTESAAMLLLVVILRAAVEHRWLATLLGSGILAVTRPVLLPVAAFILVLACWQWYRDGSRPRSPPWQPLAVATAVAAMSFAWPLAVGLVTGDLRTYFSVSAAWVHAGGLRGGWIRGLWDLGHPGFAVAFASILLALIAVQWRHRHEEGIPDHLGLWAGLYGTYIVLTTTINTSVLRYALLTLVPLGSLGPMALGRMKPAARVLLLLVVVALELTAQVWWIDRVFLMHSPVEQAGNPP